jgi:hypothetical protein
VRRAFPAQLGWRHCLSGYDPRGTRHCGASSRRELVSGRSVRILTMMQSCASVAKFRAAGHSLGRHQVPCSNTAFRHLGSSIRQSAENPVRAPNGAEWSARSGKPFQPAGRKTTPSSVSPVVTKRQSAMSSLRASATIIVLRVPTRLSAVRARYHNANALSF